ncbi:methyltransferase family protein [Novosphingobium kunmingense]|uniref:Methyltransferase family protein n=1 Tax=Novosphingobium kunmingense TaxID=1211806 RepID=A0A2N0H3H8_9SPHN|nr:methyltransferase domain-containing protein [Novosphingobium kunmingense]PKB13450.1 methyltransferase family protein [Novosphingobium kunmingense]
MSDASSPRLARTIGRSVFGADAQGYEAGRIGYPPELYEAIKGSIRFPLGTALEIGPGTGLATREILATLAPQRLILVEADAALARHLEVTIADPRVTVTCGDFVNAPVDTQVELACSAASFHWLEPSAAFARLRTLLVPNGTLALWWNAYRVTGIGDLFSDAVTPLLAGIELPPSEGVDQHYSLDVDHHRQAIESAGFERFEPFLFRRERVLTTDQIHALYASYSYIRALPPARRQALMDQIVRIAERDFGGNVPNVTLSALYLAKAPAKPAP